MGQEREASKWFVWVEQEDDEELPPLTKKSERD